MKLDQHLEIFMECVANCFRPDDENRSYSNEVSRASFRDLEFFLRFALPDSFDAIEQKHGCLSNYIYYILEQNSIEGNSVMELFKKNTNMSLVTDLMENEGYESLVLLDTNENADYYPSVDIPLEEELFQLYKDNAVKNISKNRLELRERLDRMLNNIWPNQGIHVVIFGSSANGLGTNNGDVDFCITEPQNRPRNRNKGKNYDAFYDMHFLKSQLLLMGMQNVIAIQDTGVPICKFYDPVTRLRGDINANSKLGIENTRLIRKYLELDKRVGPFLFAIKYFASSKKINDSPGGTISSYAYYLLGLHYLMAVLSNPIIYSLQDLGNCTNHPWCHFYKSLKKIEGCIVRYHDCLEIAENGKYYSPFPKRFPHYIRCSNNFDSLGTLIRGFFKYIANGGITRPCSIIKSNGEPLYPKNTRKWLESSVLIQDPFIRTKNIARPCNELGLQKILQEFGDASDLLEKGYTFQQVCSSL